MAIKDVLLPLVGEPNAAATMAIDKCVAVAGDIGARVTAIAVEQEIMVRPTVAMMSGLAEVGLAETIRCMSDALGLLKVFDAAADRIGVGSEHRLIRLAAADIPSHIARSARVKDLAIVPVKMDNGQSEQMVERLIFASGRPILICPEVLADQLAVAFDQVAIAWDHTAPAARAVADALPMLRAAANVRIVTASDRVTPGQQESGAGLVSHLAAHGIKASFDIVELNGSSVGKVLAAYVKANAIDLLVMGAYRHSRLNEMVWGGATKTVIGQPPCWVMMAH
jgi:nucleotide-binding universal stress UspA family protein